MKIARKRSRPFARIDDALEERKVWILRVGCVGMVTSDRVVCEAPHEGRIIVRGCVLERPDAQMARRDSGEHRAWQYGVARDLITGRHHSQRPGSRDAE